MRFRPRRYELKYAIVLGLLLTAACTNGGAEAADKTARPVSSPAMAGSSPRSCNGTTASVAAAGPAPETPALTVPKGLTIQTIARVPQARELAALPNGDLLVGTLGPSVYIVPHAEAAGAAAAPRVFVTVGDPPAHGVTFVRSSCSIYIGTQHGVFRVPYSDGQLSALRSTQIAGVRQGRVAPNSDGDIHRTTSVAFTDGRLYVSVGSSCNACKEVDPTRASIQEMSSDGSGMRTRATRIRNAIALAVNPQSGHLWAGGAGQDSLPTLHPYEFMDDLSSRHGVADYGWPNCEENQIAYVGGSQCASTVAPLIEFPAYITHIGAAFYPRESRARAQYALAKPYAGALLVSSHGSWHAPNGCNVAPEVDYVPMDGDTPATPVNWSNAAAQWKPFITGFQPSCGSRIGRATGIAIGSKGSVFVGDDQSGAIYRIRP
ncbi:MAG: hypothetical protein M3R51_00385 [Candidatus Eremiobacteraeota bacterium]|nr:hypothetical protein [Candidatus Eremiobacteraeota bacterium]